MKNILNVIGFEYRGYLKSKAFIITTVIFVVVILLGTMAPQLKGVIGAIISGGGERDKAMYILEGDADTPEYAAALNVEKMNELVSKYDWEQGVAGSDVAPLIEDKSYSVVLVYEGGSSFAVYGTGHDFGLYEVVSALTPYLTEINRTKLLATLPAEVQDGVHEIMETSVDGEIIAVGTGGKDGIGALQNFFLSYILLYVLFMVTAMYGQFVVSSVVSEKTTKAMELLITSAKPTHLIFGKVVGVGCAALTQLLAFLLAAALGIVINLGAWQEQLPEAGAVIKSLSVQPEILIFFVFFFLTGYFLYAFIYAGLGSTVSKIEDASAVTTIPMLLMLGSFLISIFGMSHLDAVYVKVLSYIPFFSPFIMFSRLSMGEASSLQASIALVILIVSIGVLSWLAAKIYRVGVMMYGKPMNIKQIAKVVIGK